jgi:hypothetical protein
MSHTDWFGFRRSPFLFDRLEPRVEINIFCPFYSFVDIGKYLHVRSFEEINALQSASYGGILLEATKYESDALDSQKSLQANKCLGRREIYPKYQREIDDEEPDRIVAPFSSVKELAGSFFDKGYGPKEEIC